MKNIIKLLAVLAIIFSAGCTTFTSIERMKQETENFQLPKLPEKNQAIVYIVRPSSIGTLIKFNVFVDDKETDSEVGYTKGKQYIYFSLKPGNHKILSKAENWAEINVDVKAGEIIFIKQNPSIGFIMARNSLNNLEGYQGKYYVKNLELGSVKRFEK